ncbi:MAG: helix-turn-helix transcriptional regulator, partial [Clostridia bacterium]|nr:helix-turn-helix transcriptional regulator [Clostridia bacterium]
GIFVLRRCNGIEALLEEMVQYDIVRDIDQALFRSAVMKAVIMKIILMHNAGDGGYDKLVKDIKKYIDRYAVQPLTNTQIAKRFGYHPYYLGNVFSNEEGITLHKYIMDARVKNAKERLSFTEKPISVISSEMGFKDSSYFSAFFKKVTGMTPKEYRKLYR